MRINIEGPIIEGYDNLSLVNKAAIATDWRRSPQMMPNESIEEIRSEQLINLLPMGDLMDMIKSWVPKLKKDGRVCLGFINFNYLFTLMAHRKINLQEQHNILLGNIFGRTLHKTIDEIKETLAHSGLVIEQISIDAILGTVICGVKQ